MRTKDNSEICKECGLIEESKFSFIGHDYYCGKCIKMFEVEKFIELDSISEYIGKNIYIVTEKGVMKFPQWKIVTYCINDGSPIYQRTVDAQIANGITPCCPFCATKIER